jgi:MFS family permease
VIAGGAAAAAVCAVLYAVAPDSTWVFAVTPLFGAAMGVATTGAYTAAGGVIPAPARGASFGLLSTASLTGLALSPVISGFLAATSIRTVFLLDAAALIFVGAGVSRLMSIAADVKAPAPLTEEL